MFGMLFFSSKMETYSFCRKWPSGLFQQTDQFFEFSLREVADELLVQFLKRLIEFSQRLPPLFCQGHVDHPPILAHTAVA